jgi:hypothetical protein
MAVENMLLDSEWGPAWARMRQREWRGKVPIRALVDYYPDGSCEIGLEFARP